MAKKGKFQKQKVKKPLGWKKIPLIFLAVILVLGVGLSAFGIIYYNDLLGYVSRAERTEQELSNAELEEILGFVPETLPENQEETQQETESTQPADSKYGKTGKIVNIMLVGQARRENEDSKLSDTMILVTVNKETKTIILTSFLRDMYVQLPNFKNHVCGMQRINVAYNLGWRWAGDLGGMEMLDQLILENFGVEVDHNVEINFESFKSIIDLMGGVTLELTQEEANYLNNGNAFGMTFVAGSNTLKGEAALCYARMRKASGSDSDFNRTDRQRKLITVLLKRCMKMSISEIDSLLKTVLPMVLTDMTDEEITTLMVELLPLLPELTIESHRIPIDGSYYGDTVQIGGMDAAVLKVDVEANREYLMGYCEDAPLSANAE